jgi:hypothetical protein
MPPPCTGLPSRQQHIAAIQKELDRAEHLLKKVEEERAEGLDE